MTAIKKFIERLDAYQDNDVKSVLIKKLGLALNERMINEGGDLQINIRDGNYRVVGCTDELTSLIMLALTSK